MLVWTDVQCIIHLTTLLIHLHDNKLTERTRRPTAVAAYQHSGIIVVTQWRTDSTRSYTAPSPDSPRRQAWYVWANHDSPVPAGDLFK